MDLTSININLLINKQKNNVLNLAILVLSIVIAVNIYKSQAKNIVSLNDKKEATLKNNLLLQEISQLEKKIDSYKKIINNKDISAVITTLGDIARDSSVRIVSVRPQTEIDYPVYVKYYFNLVVTAKDYHTIGKFISKIENSPQIYIVDNIDMKLMPSTEESRRDRQGVELTLSTILFKG